MDKYAQEECVLCGKRTIGVLGTGFGNPYPKENIQLMNEIIQNGGLIITEYEDEVKYNKSNFPMRNRIISGLSNGVIVIEAACKSGSTITANYAFQQEKMVFAIPGKIGDIHSVGTNRLIKRGAKLIENINDVKKEMPKLFEKRIPNKYGSIRTEYRKIYKFLEECEYTIDELVSHKKLDYEKTMEILVSMEIDGLIENINGTYRIVIE
ncbi:MAG: DNA-processing protein DprA [Clostridia bacterium]|nr:DNA-processing protein DprA [Clostridia bacterium]